MHAYSESLHAYRYLQWPADTYDQYSTPSVRAPGGRSINMEGQKIEI